MRHYRDETGTAAFFVSRRRALALGAASFAAAAGFVAFGGSAAVQARARDQDHDGFAYGASDRHGPDSQHQALIDAAQRCVSAGEACLARGSRIEAVAHMVASCGDVARASGNDAKTLKDAVARAVAFCADCEPECREGGEHHAVFEICADTCAAFVTEGRKLLQAS